MSVGSAGPWTWAEGRPRSTEVLELRGGPGHFLGSAEPQGKKYELPPVGSAAAGGI